MTAYPDFDITSKLPKVELFPVMWADEGADLDEENEIKFKDALIVPRNIVSGLSIGVGMVAGAILFLIGIILTCMK